MKVSPPLGHLLLSPVCSHQTRAEEMQSGARPLKRTEAPTAEIPELVQECLVEGWI